MAQKLTGVWMCAVSEHLHVRHYCNSRSTNTSHSLTRYLDFVVTTVDISPSKFCIYFCSSYLNNINYLFFCIEFCMVCSNSSTAHSTVSSPATTVLCVNPAYHNCPLPPPPQHKITCINSKASDYVGPSSYSPTSSPVITICCWILKTNFLTPSK